jgi:hypothetical protein
MHYWIMILNKEVKINAFIQTMAARKLLPRMDGQQEHSAMFLFNRSGLSVALALCVAALPVLIQYL